MKQIVVRQSAAAFLALSAALGHAGAVDHALGESNEVSAFAWEAPDGCPDRESVVHKVSELSADDVDLASLAPVHAWVRAEGARWRVSMRFESPEGKGERSLIVKTCDDAANFVALSLTLLLQSQQTRGLAATPVEIPSSSHPPEPANVGICR